MLQPDLAQIAIEHDTVDTDQFVAPLAGESEESLGPVPEPVALGRARESGLGQTELGSGVSTVAQTTIYPSQMDAKPPPYPDWKSQQTEPTTEYRVTFWEQPVMEDVPVDQIGWGEVTYDLEGVSSVHEAIEWVERTLASADGPYSRGGTPIRDREYVLFARVPGEDRFIQIAGWNPTVNAPATPPFNLPRQRSSGSG